MNPSADIWVEFAKSFGMLFAVLAFFLLGLYLVRRFSGRIGAKGSAGLIQVLSVHHLSPKEKLVLVTVQEKTVLIGVSPAGISRIEGFERAVETGPVQKSAVGGFQHLLKKTLVKEGKNAISLRESRLSGSGAGPDKPDKGEVS